jgi:hypothetical protein
MPDMSCPICGDTGAVVCIDYDGSGYDTACTACDLPYPTGEDALAAEDFLEGLTAAVEANARILRHHRDTASRKERRD